MGDLDARSVARRRTRLSMSSAQLNLIIILSAAADRCRKDDDQVGACEYASHGCARVQLNDLSM